MSGKCKKHVTSVQLEPQNGLWDWLQLICLLVGATPVPLL